MSRTPSRPLEPWRWLGIPTLLAIVATILFGAPLRLLLLALPEPVFPMVLAFAWAIIRPSVLGPFVLLAVGFVLDLFFDAPLGFWPVSLIVGYGVALVLRNALAGQEAEVMLLFYAVSAAATFLTAYILMVVAGRTQANIVAVLWQYLATLALFPFVVVLRNRFRDADIRFR